MQRRLVLLSALLVLLFAMATALSFYERKALDDRELLRRLFDNLNDEADPEERPAVRWTRFRHVRYRRLLDIRKQTKQENHAPPRSFMSNITTFWLIISACSLGGISYQERLEMKYSSISWLSFLRGEQLCPISSTPQLIAVTEEGMFKTKVIQLTRTNPIQSRLRNATTLVQFNGVHSRAR